MPVATVAIGGGRNAGLLAVAMVNLLGTQRESGIARGLTEALAVPGAHVHLYGKATSDVGRKLGHVTALGSAQSEALATAKRAADAIRFGGKI